MARWKTLPKNVADKMSKSNSITAKDLPSPLEYEIQIDIIFWCEQKVYKNNPLSLYVHHSPNGGKRNLVEAKKFRAMGTRAGYPDLTIDIAKGGYNGMKLELKRSRRETTTRNQEAELARLKEEGYYTVACCGYDESIAEIEKYMNGLTKRVFDSDKKTKDFVNEILKNYSDGSIIFDDIFAVKNGSLIAKNKVNKKILSQDVFDGHPPNIISAHVDKNGWLFLNECTIDKLLPVDGQHICKESGVWSYPLNCGYDGSDWVNSKINRISV